MCGVGGVFYKTNDHHRKTGEIAYHVLDGIYRRGPDSTGVALIQPPSDDMLYVGINCEVPGGGARALELLDELGRVKQATDGEGFIRAAVSYSGDDTALVDAVDALGPGYRVGSIGRQIEVVKHMGGVAQLEENFSITDYDGPLAMGLTRFATESVIDFTHAQPLSARLHRDLAIMHNGHITNYHHLRYHFEQAGYTFATGNDSETIAVMLVDEMGKGASFKEALERSVGLLDGCFTYIAVTDSEVGIVKDPYAAKPLVVGETDKLVAVSSDCWSLRDGVGEDIEVWEPGAGEVVVWQLPKH
jgi:glutamate synthase domain-containing protein 1